MATAKIQTRGFKTAVHKPVGDVRDATSIIYTVYGFKVNNTPDMVGL